MKSSDSSETGSLVLPLVIVLVLFLASFGFGIWAYAGRQDYKNNSDKKAAVAVKKAVAAEDIKKDAEHAEADKLPNKTYVGPSTYGSLVLTYPKTYNAYISEKAGGTILTEGYFNPDFVPEIKSGVAYALRFQVINTSYPVVLKTYDRFVTTKAISASAYRAPKVPSILGTMLTGQVSNKFNGIMVLLPLRDKTIALFTEDVKYSADFQNTVLANLTFIP